MVIKSLPRALVNKLSALLGALETLEFQRENKSCYVTEISFQLGPADVLFAGEKRQPEIRLRSQAAISSFGTGPKRVLAFNISCNTII